MALITLRGVTLGFGAAPLLEGVDFSIETGERVCLVGRNGAGKSTLLQIVGGDLKFDAGEMATQQGVRIARLRQEVPQDITGTVFEVVAAGLGEIGALLRAFHDISARLAAGDDTALNELARVQHDLEAADGWQLEQRVETVLSRLQLPADAPFEQLSGGLKRRVLLGQALVSAPDLLLLDEPTNHLDIDAIRWLEDYLLGFPGALLFITHDRALLRRLATRIVELDRGRLTSWPSDYDTYLERRQAALEAEATQQSLFDKKLAQEETWIRQGVKARRTRNEGRVRALEKLREEHRARRGVVGQVRMQMQEAERSGRLVLEATGVSHDYDGKPLLRGLNITILRGDKVGVIGPNGCGKSTLLAILLGKLKPQQGEVRHGTRLEIAYFDQYRAQLEEEATVLDNVAHGSDQVVINGRPRHIHAYLQDFLFSAERARCKVKSLSGGERNRVLLARLFTQPSNVLVLDEPTNDLDAETLELLEDLLIEYQGTVLLVSHDRAFLDNVVTSTLAFEGEGRVREYVGGYEDWLRQRPAPAIDPKTSVPAPAPAPAPVRERARKLSYKDQDELEKLPGRIEALETEQRQLQMLLADPELYRKGGNEVSAVQARLLILEQELAGCYNRWETLEAMR